MTLEESVEGMEKMESNSITAYIEPRLLEFLNTNGNIVIDYRNSMYGGGYTITVGDGGGCSDSAGCGGSCS